ncbi:MAG: DUF2063 domain-containing protein [Gammaproteobacteria bacterium]|nr:MAG: DUF2063 domain-containing protein [Gammaproteobacteria bacterium]
MPGATKPEFMQRQYEFAAHIRDPEHNKVPTGIEDRRMKIYRDLFYNNVEDFLSNGFPVLRELMDNMRWHALARDFFAHHQCHSPLFLEIPREFLNYLEQERGERPDDFPFLLELAHYEWVELALSVADNEEETIAADPQGDMLDGIPVLSPLAWPLSYRYPVHRISPDFIPCTPGEQTTYLLVYRDNNDEVGFIELNQVSARLFALLQEGSTRSGRKALAMIAEELQHPDPDAVINGGKQILQEWRQRGIMLGTLNMKTAGKEK